MMLKQTQTLFVAGLAAVGVVCTTTNAFVVTPNVGVAFTTQKSSSGSNSLTCLNGYGKIGIPTEPPRPSLYPKERVNPETNIQGYIPAPDSVPGRTDLGDTVLVSGWVDSPDRTDQYVFDLLNDGAKMEASPFQWKKIIAFVKDSKFAKKRLLSRSARYTGLLDLLDFMEMTTATTEEEKEEGKAALPTLEQLEGVTSWVAHVNGGSSKDPSSELSTIAQLAKDSPSIKNVAVLVTEAAKSGITEIPKAKAAIDALKESGKTYTVIAVGALTETPEGSIPYLMEELGTANGTLAVADAPTFSRAESLRILTECLALQSGANKALTITENTNVNNTEYKLIKALREAGYTRPQEIDHMFTQGTEAYYQAIQDFRTYRFEKQNNTEDEPKRRYKRKKFEFELTPEEKQERMEKKIKAFRKEQERVKKAAIEDIAREWAKREYYREQDLDARGYTQAAYVESIWDRAMEEAKVKYAKMAGDLPDDELDWQEKEELKRQILLEKTTREMFENIAKEVYPDLLEGIEFDELSDEDLEPIKEMIRKTAGFGRPDNV